MKAVKYILIVCFPTWIWSQDLDKIGKKDMVKISGGLNYTNIFYNADGITNRRQPYTYFLNGSISANVLGISLPYTFSFSNNQLSYTQPVNIQSFNPTYKWVKGYIGVTSMNFSSYTLNNHIFSGAGVELTPKNLKIAVLYGRFKKAIEYDFRNNSDINMAYRRMGWGAHVQYEKKGHGFKVSYFAAKDDPFSLAFVPENSAVKPMQNTVIGVGGKTTLYKKLVLETEFALSGVTENMRVASDFLSAPKNQLPLVFSPNSTSAFYKAYKGNLGYKSKFYGVSLNYERIDPGYKTLGAYYFNNDLENFTIAPSLSLFKGKLNINANTGLQRNNLNNNKLNSTKRWVGALNLSYSINRNWTVNTSFSNFTTFTRQRPQTDPFYKNTLDTFNIFQVSQSAMANVLYNFGKGKYKQNITMSGNYQVSGQRQGNISDPGLLANTSMVNAPAVVKNVNCGYRLLFQPTKLSISIIGNVNESVLPELDIIYAGPSLTIGKSFYKNLLRVNFGSTYNEGITNGKKANEVLNHRCSISFSPKLQNEKAGKMNFSLNSTYLQSLRSVGATPAYNEFTGTLSLGYNF